MKRPKRPTESTPGKVCQTGSSPTDSTRINLCPTLTGLVLPTPHWALDEVGSTSQSSRVQDGGKSRHAEQSVSNVHSARSSRSLARTFTRCHRSRWQVLSVQRRDPNDEFKTTAAIDRHDFHQCTSEVCWQIRQARRRHYCDD